MKKNLLKLWPIIAGFFLAFLIPIITLMPFSAFVYFVIMLSFVFLVLAFLILSIARMRMSRLDFAVTNKILSWPLPKELKPKPKNYSKTILLSFLGAGVIIFGLLIVLAGMEIIVSIFIASALALLSFGLATIGSKRIEEKQSALEDFILTHNAFVLFKDVVILDGTRNAIFETSLENNVLKLGLKRRYRQLKLAIPVPQDQIENVQAFLDKLNAHFNEQNEVLENGKE